MVSNFPVSTNLPGFMSTNRDRAAGVSINNRQFLITGGRARFLNDLGEDHYENVDTCEYLDITTQTWNKFPVNLPWPLNGHKIVFVGDRLFIMGGHRRLENGHLILSNVFALRVPDGDLWNVQAQQTWEPMADMKRPRCHFACVADGKYIYAIYGLDGFEDHPSVRSSVERYDIDNNEWELLSDIPRSVSHVGVGYFCAAAGIVGNKIFVVGGMVYDVDENEGGIVDDVDENDVLKRLDRCIVFDIESESWSRLDLRTTKRIAQHSIVTWDSLLITIGGLQEDPYEDTIDVLNTTTTTCRVSRAIMDPRHSGVAGVLMDGNEYVVVAAGGSHSKLGRTSEKISLESILSAEDCRNSPSFIFHTFKTKVVPKYFAQPKEPCKKKARYI